MNFEDYKLRRDKRPEKAMANKTVAVTTQLDIPSFNNLLYLLSPFTAARIFWDAFEATQHVTNDMQRDYAKQIMKACNDYMDKPHIRLTHLRIAFHQEVNELSEQTLLDHITMSELLTGRIFERIDNLEDF